MPKLQAKKLLNNPLFKDIYQQGENDLNAEFYKLPEEAKNLLKQSQHLILFWQNPTSYGLLAEIPNNKLAKKFAAADFPGWQTAVIKKQILVLASNADLLKNISGQKLAPAIPAYLSLNIAPWLTVMAQNSFLLNEPYQNPLLNNLQKILQPLNFMANAGNYQLTVDSTAFALTLNLIPEAVNPTTVAMDLEPYLNYLLESPDLAIGINSFADLSNQLEQNENLKAIWQKIDSYLWLNQQISLSGLIKQLKFPILFSQKGEIWQILMVSDNKNIIEKQLKSYLAQFTPREVVKKLPDGTKAIELVADESKIKWLESKSTGSASEAGWQIFSFNLPKNGSTALTAGANKLGFALKNNLLIASNQINQLKLNKLELNCSFTQVQEKPINMAITGFFTIKPNSFALKLAENLQNFSNISALSLSDGQIKMCFELK